MEKKYGMKLFFAEISIGLFALVIIITACERSGAFDFHLRHHSGKHRWGEFYELAADNGIDALVIGNSKAFSGVDCELLSERLGQGFFAIGHGSGTAATAYWSVHHALNYVSPSTILLETRCFGYSWKMHKYEAAIQSKIDLGFRKKDLSTIKATLDLHGPTSLPSAVFPNVLGYPERLERDPIDTIMNIGKWGEATEEWGTQRGFHNNFTEGIDDELLARYKAGESGRDYGSALPSAEDIEYMDRLLSLCRKKGIQLFFFETPYYQADQKNLFERQSKLTAFFADRNQDWMTFWQDKELTTNPAFYHNMLYNQHLTQDGSKVFTQKLATLIEDKKLFTNRLQLTSQKSFLKRNN